MEEVLAALLEPLVLVGYAVLASVLTVGGLALEYVGLTGGGSLVSVQTLWFVYMGTVSLFAGYLVTRDRLLPGLGAGSTADGEATSRNP